MKFYKYLIVLSFLLSLTTFVVGCGGTSSSENDPETSGKNDPALDESITDESGTAESGAAESGAAESDGAK